MKFSCKEGEIRTFVRTDLVFTVDFIYKNGVQYNLAKYGNINIYGGESALDSSDSKPNGRNLIKADADSVKTSL